MAGAKDEMNALPMSDVAIEAVINAQGELVSADPPLLNLHLRAGGFDGVPVAIPKIAMLARLALRLNTLLDRPVLATDAEVAIAMLVRARPENGHVTMTQFVL